MFFIIALASKSIQFFFLVLTFLFVPIFTVGTALPNGVPLPVHKTISFKNIKRERILFYLEKRFLTFIPNAHMFLPDKPLFCHTSKIQRLENIFEEILNEFNDNNNQNYIEVLICELLILLQRTNDNNFIAYESEELPGIVSGVLKYIASNYNKDISLNDISKHYNVNFSYLSRTFKKYTGFTYCNYLNQYRVKEANKLLSSTNKKIVEIALECGFNSSNNFCKCYKKIMGFSPVTYRKFMSNNIE